MLIRASWARAPADNDDAIAERQIAEVDDARLDALSFARDQLSKACASEEKSADSRMTPVAMCLIPWMRRTDRRVSCAARFSRVGVNARNDVALSRMNRGMPRYRSRRTSRRVFGSSSPGNYTLNRPNSGEAAAARPSKPTDGANSVRNPYGHRDFDWNWRRSTQPNPPPQVKATTRGAARCSRSWNIPSAHSVSTQLSWCLVHHWRFKRRDLVIEQLRSTSTRDLAGMMGRQAGRE